MTQDTPTVEEKFIEAGAALEHARWARWQEYMHSKFVEHENGKGEFVCLPVDLFRRWERQIGTEYASLSEEEKESDRKEVREYLPLLTTYGNARYDEGVKAERARIVEWANKERTAGSRDEYGHPEDWYVDYDDLIAHLSDK